MLRKSSTFRYNISLSFGLYTNRSSFESLDLYIVVLCLLKLLCGLRATGTSLNITYKGPKHFGHGILPSHPSFKFLGSFVLVSSRPSASDIFCANFDICTSSVLELNLVKRLDEVAFNDSPSMDTPMVLASPTVLVEENQICWLSLKMSCPVQSKVFSSCLVTFILP
jgi:hypothetical protein